MGNWFCKRLETRILIQGLDAAGKTSLLYRLKLGEVVTTIPTIGFNVETISLAGLSITCWDLGGRDNIRPLYRHYYQNTQGFVYVIDSSDRERLDEALDELVEFVFLVEETRDTVVMILANKQDKPGAMSPLDIQEALQRKYKFSSTSASAHTVIVRPCSVLTAEGVYEAFEDFTEQLRLRHAGKTKPGLLPLAVGGAAADVSAKDGSKNDASSGAREKESFAVARVKSFMKDPFSYMKSIFSRAEL